MTGVLGGLTLNSERKLEPDEELEEWLGKWKPDLRPADALEEYLQGLARSSPMEYRWGKDSKHLDEMRKIRGRAGFRSSPVK